MVNLVIESPATGMYGIWNTKTKTFMFGIQEKNRYKVHTAVSNKVGSRTYYRKPHWVVKAIRESHAPMFFKGLKRKERGRVNENNL